MGLVKPNGNITPPPTPITDETGLDIIEERGSIKETYRNSTVLNAQRDISVINRLKEFIPGTPIKVEWYHQMASDLDMGSNVSSVSFISDSVNTSFLLIKDMEVLLQESMNFDYDPESGTSVVTGECLLYPGFVPKVGDLFIYQISAGDIGMFKVSTQPMRLSFRNNTSYRINFTLVKKLETEDMVALEERTRETSYFNKRRFLQTEGGLLTEQEVFDLEYLDKKLEDLERIYSTRYYSVEFNTFLLEGEAYDPYITNFYRKSIGSYTNNNYIELLLHNDSLKYWNRSLYALLLGENVGESYLNTCVVKTTTYGQYNSLISMLHGKKMIELDVEGEGVYIDGGILSIDTEAYSEFDKLVTLFIRNNALSQDGMVTILDNILNTTMKEGFYQIPIMMFLIKNVSRAIRSGAQTNLVSKDVNPYINIPFTKLDMEDGVVTIESTENRVVGIVDDQGNIINIDDGLIEVTETTTTVDLTVILITLGIVEIVGEWFLIASNNLLLEQGE